MSAPPANGDGPRNRVTRYAVIGKLVLLALWLASLALPAAWNVDGHPDWNDGTGPVSGLDILMFGWTDMLDGQFGWLANLLFPVFLALGLGRARWKRGAILGVLLAATFVSALLWRVSWGPDDWVITPYGAGYYLWLVAIGAATVWALAAAVLGFRAARARPTTEGE